MDRSSLQFFIWCMLFCSNDPQVEITRKDISPVACSSGLNPVHWCKFWNDRWWFLSRVLGVSCVLSQVFDVRKRNQFLLDFYWSFLVRVGRFLRFSCSPGFVLNQRSAQMMFWLRRLLRGSSVRSIPNVRLNSVSFAINNEFSIGNRIIYYFCLTISERRIR